MCFNLASLTGVNPFHREYQALTLHICSAFTTAAISQHARVLFSTLLLSLESFKINISSKQKVGRNSGGGREESYCWRVLGGKKLDVSWIAIKHQMICQFC